MVCGAVVFVAGNNCSLVELVGPSLVSTCLLVKVYAPSDLDEDPAADVDVAVSTGCLGIALEDRSGAALAVPDAVTNAFFSQDAHRLTLELQLLSTCTLVSEGQRECLACKEELICAYGEARMAVCTTSLRFPPVPWDVGAVLCSAHPDCIGLALNCMDTSSGGSQDIQPSTLQPLVAGDEYFACSAAIPGSGILIVPQNVSATPAAGEEKHLQSAEAAQVMGLDWLNCNGTGFDDRWSSFHAMLIQEGVENLFADAISDDAIRLGFALLEENEDPISKAQLFASVLAGVNPPEALEGYCFGGMVSASVLDLRVMYSRERWQSASGSFMTDNVLKAMSIVRASLGPRLNHDFLACCSRWTFVSGIDLIDLTERERELRQKPLPGDVTAHVQKVRLAFSRSALAPAEVWEPLHRPSLGTCIFGLFHFGTIMNALTLLKAALSVVDEASFRLLHNKGAIKQKFFEENSGAGRVDAYLEELCRLLDCSWGLDPWNELFTMVDARYEQRTGPLLTPEAFELAQRVAEVLESAQSCDLVVSANMDLVYVSLLSRAFPAARFLYFATDSVLPHDTGTETLYLRLLADELFFRPGSRGQLLVTCEKLQVQTFYQLEQWPNLALSVSLGRRGPLHQHLNGDVLVYGRLVLQVTVFGGVLKAFNDANSHLGLQFNFAEGALSYHLWSAFRACVFLPWNLHAVSFMEFVSLNVPLLVPTGSLAYTLTKAVNMGHRQDSSIYFTNDDSWQRKGGIDGLDMPSPFWTADGPTSYQFFFWYELSHMRMRPGVQEFATAFELFDLLHDEHGLLRARARMREAYLEAVVQSVRTVAAALCAVFGCEEKRTSGS